MKNEAATVAPFSGSQYEKNSEKCLKHQTACVLCGKATNDLDNLYAHVVDGGSRFATKEEHDAADLGAGDMGCFPVGSTCAKKLKKAGVYLFTVEA